MMPKHLFFSIFFILSVFVVANGYTAEEDETLTGGPILTLKEAMIRGIENNLDIKITRINIPLTEEAVLINEAVFDPVMDATFFSSEEQIPIAQSTLSLEELNTEQGGVILGISKQSQIGLTSRLSMETYRIEENIPSYILAPEYRNYLILEIKQPLLRDFGIQINTTNLKVAENQRKQAELGFLSQVNQILRSIEKTYYDLAQAIRILEFRAESRQLAKNLLEGNRRKFETGVVPISEVQRAETAVASRDEQVLFARQQAEVISDRLRDLLNIHDRENPSNQMIITESIGVTHRNFPGMKKALTMALQKRPELKQQALEIENRDIRMAFFNNQELPRVDLTATFGINGLSGEKRNSSVPDSDYQGGYGDAFKSMAEGEGYEWSVGFNVLYPLGNRAAKSLSRQAGEEKRRSVYQYKRIENSCETEVRNAWVSAHRSLERIDVADHFISLADATLDQEMKMLEQGLSDSFRILAFQVSLIDAKIRKITAITDYNKGLSDLNYAMGMLLEHHGIRAKSSL